MVQVSQQFPGLVFGYQAGTLNCWFNDKNLIVCYDKR